MPPNRFESEVESFLEGSHGDRTHIKRADHPRLHHYAGHYCLACTVLLELCGYIRQAITPSHHKTKVEPVSSARELRKTEQLNPPSGSWARLPMLRQVG